MNNSAVNESSPNSFSDGEHLKNSIDAIFHPPNDQQGLLACTCMHLNLMHLELQANSSPLCPKILCKRNNNAEIWSSQTKHVNPFYLRKNNTFTIFGSSPIHFCNLTSHICLLFWHFFLSSFTHLIVPFCSLEKIR